MQIRLLLLALFFLGWSCKQAPTNDDHKVTAPSNKTITVKKTPAILKKLARFADSTIEGTTDVDDVFEIKEIFLNGDIGKIDQNKAATLYKGLSSRKPVKSFPIFEILGSNDVILTVQGTGFGGAIWGYVLVDRNTRDIKKIAFEHKGESEGYGAAMTQNSFEDQFLGATIQWESNTFFLEANDNAKNNGHVVQAIAGATITTQGVLLMVNQGLKVYQTYMNQ